MQTKYYLIKVIYENRDCFLIWYSDDEDGFYCSGQKLVMFPTLNEIKEFAGRHGIFLETEITEYDFTNIMDCINNIELSENCHTLLAAWNFFSDFAKTINGEFIGDSEEKIIWDIYQKLFYGSNLKVLKKDEEYHPAFDNEERQKCVSVFQNGLSLFEKLQNE